MVAALFDIYQQPFWFIICFSLLLIWSMVWKGLALWHSAKNQQKGWYVVMFIINTAGILEIIYLIWFRPKERKNGGKTVVEVRKSVKRKK